MSYCITQEELDRRALCPDTVCAPPSFIRETIIEPILGPIFDDTPFSSSPVPWGGGGRWFGGGSPRHRPSWRPGGPPQHHGTPGPGNTANRPGRPVRGPLNRSPKDDFPRRPSTSIAYAQTPMSYEARPMAPTPAQRYQAAPTTYTAHQTTRPAQTVYRAAPNQYTAMPMRQQPQTVYRAAPTTYSKSLKGLGQIADGVSRWKYAALGLAGLVVAQFWWWNKKAPQVLRLGGY